MKLTSHFIAVCLLAATTTTAIADETHETTVYSNSDMKQVLAELHELKSEVQELKQLLLMHNQMPKPVVSHTNRTSKRWSCFINTAFDGTFIATGFTKNEALGKTLGKCNHKSGSSVSCNESKVACSTE